MRKTSLQPISDAVSKILILGTLPGEKSLELQQYYAHPRNRFWKFLANAFSSDCPTEYSEKTDWLKKHKVALWDVAHSAIRQGSLDSNIRHAESNDLIKFLSEHPSIEKIAFNGQKAEKLYDRHFTRQNACQYISLPSSSPANTRFTYDQLQNEWGKLIK